MKITITYKSSAQISPEDFAIFTEVISCNENETLKDLHNRLTKKWSNKKFDGEIHFREENNEYKKIKKNN